MNNNNDLLKRFLNARSLIDSQPVTKSEKETYVSNAQVATSGLKNIIATKPKNKVVIEFLRQEVAKLIDDTDSD